MHKFLEEIASTVVSVALILIMLSSLQPSIDSVGTALDKMDGLEKVSSSQLIDNSVESGTYITGEDVIGAIRYYQGTSGITIQVSGWGTTVVYGTGSGQISTQFDFGHIAGLSSELEFYEAKFSVTNTDGIITYAKV